MDQVALPMPPLLPMDQLQTSHGMPFHVAVEKVAKGGI